MAVEAHGVTVPQHLDVSIPDELAQLAFGHSVMQGDLGQGQRRIAGTGKDEARGWGGSHLRISPGAD